MRSAAFDKRWRVVVAVGGVTLTALAAGSCSGGDDAVSPPSWPIGKGGQPIEAGVVDAGEPADAASSLDGWTPLTGFDPACPLLVAPADALPPPHAWEPCDSRVHGGDAGGVFACRQIADNWGAGGSPDLMPIGPVLSAYADPITHDVLLPVPRFTDDSIIYVVGHADGVVEQAIVATDEHCVPDVFSSISATSVIYPIHQVSADFATVLHSGAIGGAFASPGVLARSTNAAGSEYVAGAHEYAEIGYGPFAFASWIDGHVIQTLGTTAPGDVVEPVFQGDDFFFEVGDLTEGRIQHAQADGGGADFISFGDTTQSIAADFATDGIDMVWTEGTGHASETAPWQKIDIMTASYTTNAGAIVKRRLRSESGTTTPGSHPFVVGCGYAAHEYDDPDAVGIRVVRLSDGRSWRFGRGVSDPLAWNDPIALTCDEVFVNFNFGSGKTNLARIRLDSLGPGEPAD